MVGSPVANKGLEVGYVSSELVAICPVCERQESVQDRALGRAWLTGHILEEHEDELPPVRGVE